MSRITHPTFTVSVAGMILDAGGRVLLLDHVLRPGSGWGLPGGFINRGEQPEAAFRREIIEETGIEVSDLELYRVATLNKHVEILFTARALSEPRVLTLEVYRLDWFDPGKLPPEMNASQQRLIQQVLGTDV